MRSLAAFLAEAKPDLVALDGIDKGDALATATRFDRDWAYLDGGALLWDRRRFAAHQVADRRSVLCVEGAYAGAPLRTFFVRFASDRSSIRELRALREALRAGGAAVLFLVRMRDRIGLSDLGVRTLRCQADSELSVAVRGFTLTPVEQIVPARALGARVVMRADAAKSA